jgi:flagellar biosynthesis protein FlhA
MSSSSTMAKITRHSDVVVAVAVVFIVVFMVIPIPAPMLDVLLAFNITAALVILMVALYVQEPLEFSVYPGMLLVVTLFRLSLNVASTRLILGDAYAGNVIAAFGGFVVKGNYVVGFIIFLILVIINFVVITKGAGRIAEVAARFTLDAMPGKQMAIDADLNNGMIDEEEAKNRREKIGREADFYGAMDGAAKFVRGDAIAGLVITVVNIIGGFIIGIWQLKLSFLQALQTYTLLTVGDGLVTQIPALIISTSAGIIVSRAASESNMGHDLTKQILAQPRALYIASGVLIFFAITPGLPILPFLTLGIIAGIIGRITAKAMREEKELKEAEEAAKTRRPEERIADYLYLDPLEIEIGYGLIPVVDTNQGGDLLDRITMIRRQFAMEYGLVIPPVRIRDNTQLMPNAYSIKIKGNEVGGGELRLGHFLVVGTGTEVPALEGIPTKDPTFGMPSRWIPTAARERAEIAGYTVIEPSAVLATHFVEILRREGWRILTREAVSELIDNLKRENKTVVEELVPNLLTVGAVQKVLQNLLKEGVPVRDFATIMETLADFAPITKDTAFLTETVRNSLGTTIAARFSGPGGVVRAITLDPDFEAMLTSGVSQMSKEGREFSLSPEQLRLLANQIHEASDEMSAKGWTPVIVTAPAVRPYFRKIIEPAFPTVPVLSFGELPPNTPLESVGVVGTNVGANIIQ